MKNEKKTVKKEFKKPIVNEKERKIDKDFVDEESNKKLIIIISLSIVVVLGLIIGSVFLFDKKGKEEKESKKDPDVEISTTTDKDVSEDEVIETIAVVEERYYYLTIKDSDGKILLERTKKIADPDDFVAPIGPTKAGYRFTGWKIEWKNDNTEVILTANYIKTWNVTLYDGDTILDSVTVDNDTTFAKPAPTKIGYKLIDVYTNDIFSTEYSSSKITADTSLYTNWLKDPEFSVREYTKSDATPPFTIDQDDVEIRVENNIIYLSGKTTYTDSAIRTSVGYSTKTHVIPLFITAPSNTNVTWTSKTINGVTTPVTVTPDNSSEPYLVGIDATNGIDPLAFVISYTDGENTYTYNYTLNINNLELLPEVGTTYTITYEAGLGTAPLMPTTYVYKTGLSSLPDATPEIGSTKIFVGWYKEATFENKVTSISTDQYGDITLYARYEEPYEITYLNMDGAVNHASNKAVYTIADNAFVLQTPLKIGYKFLGWTLLDEDGIDVLEITPTNIVALQDTGEVTLYANWELITYTIKYNVNNPTNATLDPVTLPDDDEIDVTDLTGVTLPDETTFNATDTTEIKEYEMTGWSLQQQTDLEETPPTLETSPYILDTTDANANNEINMYGVWQETID